DNPCHGRVYKSQFSAEVDLVVALLNGLQNVSVLLLTFRQGLLRDDEVRDVLRDGRDPVKTPVLGANRQAPGADPTEAAVRANDSESFVEILPVLLAQDGAHRPSSIIRVHGVQPSQFLSHHEGLYWAAPNLFIGRIDIDGLKGFPLEESKNVAE